MRMYILAMWWDSNYIELYSSTATVSLSPIAPLCLHAPPIDSSIDIPYQPSAIASCNYIDRLFFLHGGLVIAI